jgi:hypothetical protein
MSLEVKKVVTLEVISDQIVLVDGKTVIGYPTIHRVLDEVCGLSRQERARKAVDPLVAAERRAVAAAAKLQALQAAQTVQPEAKPESKPVQPPMAPAKAPVVQRKISLR